MNRLILSMVILASSFSINAGTNYSSFENPGMIMSVQDLAKNINNPKLRLIDAQDATKYETEHIPGAINIPIIPTVSRTEVLDNGKTVKGLVMLAEDIQPVLRAAGINNDSHVVIYSNDAFRASRIWWILDYYGHQNLTILDGGLAAWKANGGEVSLVDSEAPAKGNFVPVSNPAKVVDFNHVNSILGDSEVVLVDALSSKSYSKGHIPGAVNIFFGDTLDSDNNGTLQSASKLQNLFTEVGANKNSKEVIFYCGGGWVSAHEVFVARLLGYDNVRLYDGSKWDWIPRGGKIATK